MERGLIPGLSWISGFGWRWSTAGTAAGCHRQWCDRAAGWSQKTEGLLGHCLLRSVRLCRMARGLRKQDKSPGFRSDRGLETVVFLNKNHQHSLSCPFVISSLLGIWKAFKILSCLFSQTRDKKYYKATNNKEMKTQMIWVSVRVGVQTAHNYEHLLFISYYF